MWWNFLHWLQRKLSKWEVSVLPATKLSSKSLYFRYNDASADCAPYTCHPGPWIDHTSVHVRRLKVYIDWTLNNVGRTVVEIIIDFVFKCQHVLLYQYCYHRQYTQMQVLIVITRCSLVGIRDHTRTTRALVLPLLDDLCCDISILFWQHWVFVRR